MRDPGSPGSGRAGARPYLLLALLTGLNVLSWVDRQIIPALAPLLMADLGLTSARIGLLYGYGFIVWFVLAGFAVGPIADRVHRPRLIAAGLAVWSVFTGVSGLARSFVQLAAARLMVGVGEATLTPASLAMLAEVFPPRFRARATGIFATGVTIGSGLSLVVAGLLAPRYGWRACFFVLGAAGVCAALFVARFPDPGMRAAELRPAPEEGALSATGEDSALRVGRPVTGRPEAGRAGPLRQFLGVLRHSPALVLITLGGVIVTFSTTATIHVLAWLVRERGYEFRDAAVLAGGIYAVAGTAGNVAGGWFADWCEVRWRGGRVWSLVVTQAVLVAPALAFFTTEPGTPVFYVAWVLSGLRGTIWYGPLFAAVQDLAPAGTRATAVAFLMLAINLLGAGPGPWVAGAIGDATSLTNGLALTTWAGLLAVVPFAMAARAQVANAPTPTRVASSRRA